MDLYRGSVGTLAHDYIQLVQIMPNWVLEVLLKNAIPQKEAAKVSFVLRPHHDQEGERGPIRLGELPGGNPRLTAPRMLRVRKVVGHVAEKLSLSPPKRTMGEGKPLVTTSTNAESLPPPRQSQVLEPVQEEESGYHPTDTETTPSEPVSTSNPTPTSSTPPPPAATTVFSSIHEMTPEEEEEDYIREQALRPENWLEILCNDQVLPPTMTLATIRTHYWKTSSDVVLTYRYRLSGAAAVVAPVLGDIARSLTPVSSS